MAIFSDDFNMFVNHGPSLGALGDLHQPSFSRSVCQVADRRDSPCQLTLSGYQLEKSCDWPRIQISLEKESANRNQAA